MSAAWLRRLLGLCDDTRDEARGHLARLAERDEQVRELAEQLRAAQRRNHFSEMVTVVISRTRDGGAT